MNGISLGNLVFAERTKVQIRSLRDPKSKMLNILRGEEMTWTQTQERYHVKVEAGMHLQAGKCQDCQLSSTAGTEVWVLQSPGEQHTLLTP